MVCVFGKAHAEYEENILLKKTKHNKTKLSAKIFNHCLCFFLGISFFLMQRGENSPLFLKVFLEVLDS